MDQIGSQVIRLSVSDQSQLHELRNFLGPRHLRSGYGWSPAMRAPADWVCPIFLSWPPAGWRALQTAPGPADPHARLMGECEDVGGVALCYSVGPGKIDADGHLCLALPHSRTEPNHRAPPSLPFHAVRKALLDSPAAT